MLSFRKGKITGPIRLSYTTAGIAVNYINLSFNESGKYITFSLSLSLYGSTALWTLVDF
jgi:hypothetical protein